MNLETELLSRSIDVCNRASIYIKEQLSGHESACLTLDTCAAELTLLLLELQRLHRPVDREWADVAILRDEIADDSCALPQGSGIRSCRCINAGQAMSGNSHFYENIVASEDSRQVIAATPWNSTLVRNVTAGSRSIQEIGSQIPLRERHERNARKAEPPRALSMLASQRSISIADAE